jgi:hypothetical protein
LSSDIQRFCRQAHIFKDFIQRPKTSPTAATAPFSQNPPKLVFGIIFIKKKYKKSKPVGASAKSQHSTFPRVPPQWWSNKNPAIIQQKRAFLHPQTLCKKTSSVAEVWLVFSLSPCSVAFEADVTIVCIYIYRRSNHMYTVIDRCLSVFCEFR